MTPIQVRRCRFLGRVAPIKEGISRKLKEIEEIQGIARKTNSSVVSTFHYLGSVLTPVLLRFL